MSESIPLLPTHQAAIALGEPLPGIPCHHTSETQGGFPSTLSGQLTLIHLPQEMDQPLLKTDYHLFLSNILLLIKKVLVMSYGLKYHSV